MNLVDILRDDYGCGAETIGEVVRWVGTLDERDKLIFSGRIQGKSMRAIAREIGITHPTVSATISGWTELREKLEEAMERLW